MKLARNILFVSFLILGLTQCKTSKKTVGPVYNPNAVQPFSYDGRIITFGSGGGFAGRIQQWTLMDDGTLFPGEEVKNIAQGVKLDESLTAQMFKLYDDYRFGELELNDPGNLYFFITMIDKGVSHKVVWGEPKNKILAKYHYTLYKIAKSKTKTVKAPKSPVTNQ